MPAVYILIVFASFFGFLLALYIQHKKSSGEQLICPIGSDCRNVIHSDYSRFLGMPVELLGLFYYGLTALSYGVLVAAPDLKISSGFILGVLALSFAAFLFSLYLTFIQAFYLRQWCSWCLMSAGLCTLILFSAFLASDKSFGLILAESQTLIQILTIFAGAIGAGSATLAAFLVFSFVKDLKISFLEAGVIRFIDQISWLALGGVSAGIAGNYFAAGFIAEGTAMPLPGFYLLPVLISASAFLYLLILPRMVKISLGESHVHRPRELKTLKNSVLLLGLIALLSWYGLFFTLILP